MSYYDDYSYENDQPAQYDPENAWLYEQNDNQNTRVSEKMSCKYCVHCTYYISHITFVDKNCYSLEKYSKNKC